MDPQSQRVTHVVVRKGIVFTEDKVLPLEMIASADEKQVRLRDDVEDLEALPDFIEEEYIPIDADWRGRSESWGYVPPFYWYPPMGHT